MPTWLHQRQATNDLLEHLEEILSTLTLESTSGKIFSSAAGLYRCNRYLGAIVDAVEMGTGDTAGGNLRTLYETWVLGHLLLLSNFDEARIYWAGTRHSAEKVIKAVGASVEYPEDTPEAVRDKSAEERAKLLTEKLKVDDPANAAMPSHCYDFIYRSESLISSHANLTAIMQYARPVGRSDGSIGLNGKNKGCEWRAKLASYITMYYAQQLFKKAGISRTRLNEIETDLDPNIEGLSRPSRERHSRN